VVVALSATAVSATAAAAHAAPGGNDVPLHLSVSGTPGAGPFSWSVKGSPIGQGTISGTITVTGFSGCGVQFVATATLTAANGDTIDTTASGETCLNTTPAVSTATITITGGTGRFSNATGSATSLLFSDFSTVPGTLTGTIDGTINLNK
jgi:hypothetical protein